MSYTPTTWKAGDTVTSEKLNKIEQGIVSNSPNILIVHLNDTDGVYTKILDKTWQEIYDAMPLVYVDEDTEDTHTRQLVTTIEDIGIGDFRYRVFVAYLSFVTSSPNGYPGILPEDDGK